jgi:hypothetical protein
VFRDSAAAGARLTLRRENVVWSGIARFTWSRLAIERSSPSVGRHGRPKGEASQIPGLDRQIRIHKEIDRAGPFAAPAKRPLPRA